MATLITTTYADRNGDVVSVFSVASAIVCECGSHAGYLETVASDLGRTFATVEWTCSECVATNVEHVKGAAVGQAFDAMRA